MYDDIFKELILYSRHFPAEEKVEVDKSLLGSHEEEHGWCTREVISALLILANVGPSSIISPLV